MTLRNFSNAFEIRFTFNWGQQTLKSKIKFYKKCFRWIFQTNKDKICRPIYNQTS